MINAAQHTDSGERRDLSRRGAFHAPGGDTTEGTADGVSIFALSGEANPVQQAGAIVSHIENPSAARQVSRLLSTIQKLIRLVQEQGVYVDQIPPLHASKTDDGSVVLEWIFPEFRVGFNIEPSAQDSGWHLVSSKKLGDIAVSGPLSSLETTVAMLLEYILKNT